jgi:hypothetical protein
MPAPLLKNRISALTSALLSVILPLSLIAPELGAQQANLAPPRGPIPAAYFGLHIHHLWSDPVKHQWNEAEWPTVPFGSWRLWDAHVLWTYLEPAQNQYDFKILDHYIEDTESRGIQTVLTLEGTPSWASARPQEVPMHQGGEKGPVGAAAEPRQLADWENFVRTVGTRYKGKIHFYEIWNEPMFKPYYSGSPEAMVAMVRSAAAVLKQIDPTIRVLQPPVSGQPDGLAWLDSFLAAGGGKYVDIYSFHLYPGGNGAPEINVAKTSGIHQVLRKYGEDAKPMWTTEEGWEFPKRDPQTNAAYVARALLLGWPLGYGRLFIYSWDHNIFGLAPDNKPGTPMAQAFTTVEHWMVGSTMTRCVQGPDGLWVVNLTLPDGSQGKVLWSANGDLPLGKDHLAGATGYTTIDGRKFTLNPSVNLKAGPAPILLTFNGKAY